MINYHELTMSESRDSPARRKQYLVICTIMAAAFFHSLFTSGVLTSLDIMESTFPGGEYVYKFVVKDYATNQGVIAGISTNDLKRRKSAPTEDLFYTIFLDNSGDGSVGANNQRYASGMLNGSPKDKETLLSKNTKAPKLSAAEEEEKSFTEIQHTIQYEAATLPKVKALACNFPFTNGFVSALITTYKLVPGLMKYAESQGLVNPVVISTCSISQSACTYYVPLKETEQFLLGRPDSKTYQKTFGDKSNSQFLDWVKVSKGSKRMLKKMPPFSFFMSSAKKPTSSESSSTGAGEEL